MSDDEIRFGFGGNQPPLEETAQLAASEALAKFEARKQEFLGSLAKVAVANRGDAGAAADKLKLAHGFLELIDAERDRLITPHRKARDAVNATFSNFTDDVEDAVRGTLAKIKTYTDGVKAKAETQRQEQAALAIKARPAIDYSKAVDTLIGQPQYPSAVAEALGPKPKPIRGDLGTRVVERARKRAYLVDRALVPDFIMDSADVKAAIEKVATSMLKQFPNPPGFEVRETESIGVQ